MNRSNFIKVFAKISLYLVTVEKQRENDKLDFIQISKTLHIVIGHDVT